MRSRPGEPSGKFTAICNAPVSWRSVRSAITQSRPIASLSFRAMPSCFLKTLAAFLPGAPLPAQTSRRIFGTEPGGAGMHGGFHLRQDGAGRHSGIALTGNRALQCERRCVGCLSVYACAPGACLKIPRRPLAFPFSNGSRYSPRNSFCTSCRCRRDRDRCAPLFSPPWRVFWPPSRHGWRRPAWPPACAPSVGEA